MRNKNLLLSGIILSFALALFLSIAIIAQSGFIYKARAKHFDKKSRSFEKKISENASFFILGMQEIGQSHKIAEIFSKRALTTSDFNYSKQTDLTSLYLVNPQGVILFSTELFLTGKSIYSNVISWNTTTEPSFFFTDEDTMVGMVRFQDPSVSEQLLGGYVIAKFPSDVILEGLPFSKIHMRAVNTESPVLLIDDTRSLSPKLISTLAQKFRISRDELNENIVSQLKVPYFSPLLFYFGNKIYVPIFGSLAILLLVLLGVMLLLSYMRYIEFESVDQDDFLRQTMVSNQYDSVSQLVSDIENNVTYDESASEAMMNDAVQYGVVKEIDFDDHQDELREIGAEETSSSAELASMDFVMETDDLNDDFFTNTEDLDLENATIPTYSEQDEEGLNLPSDFEDLAEISLDDLANDLEDHNLDSIIINPELTVDTSFTEEPVENLAFSAIESLDKIQEELEVPKVTMDTSEFDALLADDELLEISEPVEDEFSNIDEVTSDLSSNIDSTIEEPKVTMDTAELDDLVFEDENSEVEIEVPSFEEDIDDEQLLNAANSIEQSLSEFEDFDFNATSSPTEDLSEVTIDDPMPDFDNSLINNDPSMIDNIPVLEQESLSDDIFDDNENIELQDNLEEISAEEFNELLNNIGHFDNPVVESRINRLIPLLKKFDIRYYRAAELDGNEFNFDIDGQKCTLSKDSILFETVLSQHKVLSISGNVLEFEQVKDIFPQSFIEKLGELFLEPVLDESGEVQGIVMLGRDETQPELSLDDKRELFIEMNK
ncbi:MAG: hypothetical protein ACRCS8_01760 [Brevinema sp.]